MTYAYDQGVQLPVMSLYDNLIMLASIQAAREMYNQARDDMNKFYDKYGEFYTPITKDLEYYNLNIVGPIMREIQDMYDRGEDPLRNQAARARLSQLQAMIPRGDVAQLKLSAENAKEFLKARKALEAQGLYSPEYYEYDGPNLDTYSTLGKNGQGVWDKMSPTPMENISKFGDPYYTGMKPNIKKESRNGIDYRIESINLDDLKNIAEQNFGDIIKTPQGEVMYRRYLDIAKKNGDENPEKSARDMLTTAVAEGQRRRIYTDEAVDDNFYKAQNLKLQQSSNALAWKKFEWDKEKEQQELELKRLNSSGTGGQNSDGVSLYKSWYDTAIANAWSADGFAKNWREVGDSYDVFGNQVGKIFNDYGKTFKRVGDIKDEDVANYILANGTDGEKGLVQMYKTIKATGSDKNSPADKGTVLNYKNLIKKYKHTVAAKPLIDDIQNQYRQKFSIAMDGISVAKICGTPLSENNRVSKIAPGIVSKLYGTDDIISNTAGYVHTHTSKSTKEIRDAINKWGVSNTTVSSLDEGYGSLRKNTGSFEVMPRVVITCTDDEGNVRFKKEAYVDIDLGSFKTRGGANLSNYNSFGGVYEYGNMTNPSTSYRMGEYDMNGEYHPGGNNLSVLSRNYSPIPSVQLGESSRRFAITPEFSTPYNMYPDDSRWTGFGVWDTDLTSSRLHAGQSKKLSTY